MDDVIATPTAALAATRVIAAISIGLGAVELWRLRAIAGDRGVWRWATLRQEYPAWLAGALTPVMAARGFAVHVAARLALAVALVVWSHAAIAAALFASTLLLSVRWRGTWNGGSDFMTLIVTGALTVGLSGGEQAARGATWYIALQAATSYFIAGLVKLRQPLWRDGSALAGFLVSGVHGVTPRIARWSRAPALMVTASWATMLVEVAFPLAIVSPYACAPLLAAGALFHLGNVYALGLNRFWWAWLATYPAVAWAAIHGELGRG